MKSTIKNKNRKPGRKSPIRKTPARKTTVKPGITKKIRASKRLAVLSVSIVVIISALIFAAQGSNLRSLNIFDRDADQTSLTADDTKDFDTAESIAESNGYSPDGPTSNDDTKNQPTLSREELLRRGGPDLPGGYVPLEEAIRYATFSIKPSSTNVVLNSSGFGKITLAGDSDKIIDSISYSGYDTSSLRPMESYSSSYCSLSNPCEIVFVHTNSPGPLTVDGSTTVNITGYNKERNKYSTVQVTVSWSKFQSTNNDTPPIMLNH